MKTRIVLGVVLLAALLLISHVIVKARTFAQRRGELLEQSPNEVTLTLRAVAEKQPVRRSKEWSGSVQDEKLAKDAPTCVTSARALEQLWKDWKLTDKMPDIDFQKELVVVSTARGSRLPRSPRPSSTFRTSSSPGTQGTVGSGLRRAGLPLAGLAHGRGLAHHLVGQLDHAPVGLSQLRNRREQPK